MYNERHIWGVRRKEGKHYKVDSIGGVRPININSLRHQKNIGLLVPVSMYEEWKIRVDCINDILNSHGVKRRSDVKNLLTRLNSTSSFLGDLEIPLGVATSIMETNMVGRNKSEFKPICGLIDRYNQFISKVTKGRYSDLDLVLESADIIFDISLLRRAKQPLKKISKHTS